MGGVFPASGIEVIGENKRLTLIQNAPKSGVPTRALRKIKEGFHCMVAECYERVKLQVGEMLVS